VWTWGRRRRAREGNSGRDYGWAVLRDGLVVGELRDPFWEAQFWHSYRFDGPVRRRPRCPRFDILSPVFWESIDGLEYLNLVLGLRPPGAFPAARPVRCGRVWTRGLYV